MPFCRAAPLVWLAAILFGQQGVPPDEVGGLERGDFEIEDSGKKREITPLTAETATHPAPGGENKKTDDEKRSSVLPPPPRLSMGPGDLIPARKGIFFISRGQILPFTGDAAKLKDALDKLTIANRDLTLLSVQAAEAMQCGFCQRRDPSCLLARGGAGPQPSGFLSGTGSQGKITKSSLSVEIQ